MRPRPSGSIEVRSRKRLARLAAVLAAGATAGAAQAATITVNSIADTTATDSQCTLREALLNANGDSDTTGGDCVAGSGADTIQFSLPNPSTITLGGTQLVISDSATISGPGQTALTISGNNASRIFYIHDNARTLDVTISALTLTQGVGGGAAVLSGGENLTLTSVTATANSGDQISVNANGSLNVQSSVVTGAINGRAIRVDHVTAVTIAGTTLSNNTSAGKGAGAFLYRTGPVLIDDTTISGNSASNRGGGLFLYNTEGPVTISSSRITGNSAGSRGGGINLYKPLADVTIEDTTISGNVSTNNRGGGIFFYKQGAALTMTIRNTTISGNSAGPINQGGAIFFYRQSGTTVIENSTISGNSAQTGGGIFDDNINPSASLIIRNSTINGNTATNDTGNIRVLSFPNVQISNSIIANGTAPANPDLQTGASNVTVNYSLIEDPTGATFAGANNTTGVDPQLEPLANNGGPTPTHLPALTSPVIDAGDPAFVAPPATDQRGSARVAGGRIDMGSVEVDGGTIQLSSATYSVNEADGTITITITRTGQTDPATVDYATSNGSAVEPGDYTLTTGTANFAAGATSATFDVPIVDDATFEGNETFTITLGNVSATATPGAPSSATVTIVDNELPVADLSITKSVSGSSFFVGQPVTFNIAVNNAGPQTAGSVVVTDILPAGTTFVSAAPSQGSCSGATTITCTLGSIANGGNATIALTVTTSAAGPLSNTATVADASSVDPNPANSASTAVVTISAEAANVPLFGDFGKLLFTISAALLGLFVIRKQSS